jgi:hypothetical protein
MMRIAAWLFFRSYTGTSYTPNQSAAADKLRRLKRSAGVKICKKPVQIYFLLMIEVREHKGHISTLNLSAFCPHVERLLRFAPERRFLSASCRWASPTGDCGSAWVLQLLQNSYLDKDIH